MHLQNPALPYILIECRQGSAEWLNARAGVITASDFRKARSKMKQNRDGKKVGDPTDAALDLAFQKAIERVSKVPLDENHQTWQMKRGHELEPWARAAHEELLSRRGGTIEQTAVMQAGFMLTPDGKFGCSVDGLIGEIGGSEYKCLASSKSMRPVILFDDIDDFTDQVQGCLAISGRKWWHFGLYCPALKPCGLEFKMIEVQRDENYIDALWDDLLAFERIVTDYELTLRRMGADAIESAVEEVRARLAEPVSEEEPAEVA